MGAALAGVVRTSVIDADMKASAAVEDKDRAGEAKEVSVEDEGVPVTRTVLVSRAATGPTASAGSIQLVKLQTGCRHELTTLRIGAGVNNLDKACEPENPILCVMAVYSQPEGSMGLTDPVDDGNGKCLEGTEEVVTIPG